MLVPSLVGKSFVGLITLLACLALAVVARGQGKKPADIPIKRVVMFSSGVAFFEHAGQVEGNAQVDLEFNVRDINDLLKSMVLQDEGGGKISTISYGSKDPLTRTLSRFSVNLTENPTLADLLNQVRGEQIAIEGPTELVGTILGVETREVPAGKEQVVKQSYLNLLTDEGLASISLENVGRIKLADEKLNAELKQALAVLAAGKSMDKKTVTLNFLGEGKRDVKVGYIQEAPIWKTSYRLVLDDEDKPLLQGWAIVENTTENDWDDVSLSLISGRPISFVMDLYEPLYLARPEVKMELYASLRPRTYEQDLAAAGAEFRKAGERLEEQAKREKESLAQNRQLDRARASLVPARPASPAADAYQRLGGRSDGAALDSEFAGKSSMASIAQAADVGEMFRYQIATPVKLARGKSAMLPIVNESVEGAKVSIYNEATHAKHPLSGLKLKNSTDLHLMQGPITVFAGGTYAGDAQIQDLPPGSERLISYAMDLDTEVAPLAKPSPDRLVSVKIAKGLLITHHKYERNKSYTIKNSGKEAKQVLIEYPLEAGWTLVAPQDPAEKTRDMYRFAVHAEPGKPATLEVKEERTASQQVALSNLDDNTILFYINAPAVSEAVKEALREVLDRKGKINSVVNRRQELERQISVIDQEQKRIRENMAQLPKDSDLFRRYVGKFTDQEDQIDELRKQVSTSVDEEQKLRKSLDDFLLGLELA